MEEKVGGEEEEGEERTSCGTILSGERGERVAEDRGAGGRAICLCIFPLSLLLNVPLKSHDHFPTDQIICPTI